MAPTVGNNPISYIDPFGLKPNNPGDDSESEKQRADVEKMLRDLVNRGKANLDRIVLLAGFEGGGAIAAERLTVNQLAKHITEHAFEKHVLFNAEYPGIRTESQFGKSMRFNPMIF